MQLQRATRSQVKLKLWIAWPSGSWKTYSALQLASWLTSWDKIAVIDTENWSASLYSHLWEYNTLQLEAPFTPEKYIKAIEVCEQAWIEVVIIDSMAHEWDGKWWVLEIHWAMTGNSFTNWAKVTPRHNAFIWKIMQSRCHVIWCMRVKQDYVINQNSNWRSVPEKVWLKAVTRDGVDYEFTTVFDVDIRHYATAAKDRTWLFVDLPWFLIWKETWEQIKAWNESGAVPKSIPESKPEPEPTWKPKFSSKEHFPKFKERLLNWEYDAINLEDIFENIELKLELTEPAKKAIEAEYKSRLADQVLANMKPDPLPDEVQGWKKEEIEKKAKKEEWKSLAETDPEGYAKAQNVLKKELNQAKIKTNGTTETQTETDNS